MTIKQIQQQLDEELSLKLIAQAFTEISSIRLKKIRSDVEKNRLFFEEIAYLYYMVNKAAKAVRKENLVVKNDKIICLALTSNYRFYGNLNEELIKAYIKETSNMQADRMVIGRTGLEYIKSASNIQFSSLMFKKDLPDDSELNSLVTQIKGYSKILVFYSKFKSVLVQIPTVSDVKASPNLRESEDEIPINFVFEPELKNILEFFDKQITRLLLEQTFLESELSRIGARLISMDQAQANADKSIKDQTKLLLNEKRSLINIKTLEAIITQNASRRIINNEL